MDIQTKKKKLIQLLMNTEEESVLDEIETLLKRTRNNDWWNTLNEQEKKSIEKGITEANEGKLIAHDQVMEEIYSKYNLKKP